MHPIDTFIIDSYNKFISKIENEPWRRYHDRRHVSDILDKAHKKDYDLKLFAVFHDWHYEPWASDNEVRSCSALSNEVTNAFVSGLLVDSDFDFNDVKRLIALSKHEYNHYKDLSESDWYIIKHDLSCFLDLSTDVYTTEKAIFHEYQSYDYNAYKQGRINILNTFKSKLEGLPNNIDNRIKFLYKWTPSIGLYPGTFNPFHAGHLDILTKAEKIFDKVIVAVGINSSKPHNIVNINTIQKQLQQYRQVTHFDGSIVRFINTLRYPVTIIRGLRDSSDFISEQKYMYNLQDITDIKICHIISDRNLTHVSSSAIREIESLGHTSNYTIKHV